MTETGKPMKGKCQLGCLIQESTRLSLKHKSSCQYCLVGFVCIFLLSEHLNKLVDKLIHKERLSADVRDGKRIEP